MNKLKTINRIRYKLIGNIKNKSWFKNYKDENIEMSVFQAVSILPFSTLYWCGLCKLIDMDLLIKKIGFLTIFPMVVCIILGVFNAFILTMISGYNNKIKMDRFIKKSGSMEDSVIGNMVINREIFKGGEHIISFIRNQPLDKEDLENFNKMLNEEFSKDELNHLYYNEKLNDMLKNNGGINYNYIIYALNLLEKKETNKMNDIKLNNIKDNVFRKDEFVSKNKKQYEEKMQESSVPY